MPSAGAAANGGVPIESNEASVVVPKTDPAATCQALGLINSQNYVHATND